MTMNKGWKTVRLQQYGGTRLSPAELQRLRRAYREFLKQLNPTHTVTFKFGYPIDVGVAFEKMTRFCHEIQRAALGRNWHKKPAAQRLLVFAFAEDLEASAHWHGIAEAPGPVGEKLESEYAEARWRHHAPRGHWWSAKKDSDAATTYATKKLKTEIKLDAVLIYARGSGGVVK